MKQGREMINRIENENYERELELCLKLGGDVDKYRRLSFDALQLEQICRGLEKGISVESYLDPELSWMEMENRRLELETGVSITRYEKEGFSVLQCNEIREGLLHKIDVSKYAQLQYMPTQMQQIRKGLEKGLDVSRYRDPDWNWMQMREIRRGMEEKVDVSKYMSKDYSYFTMRAIRKALINGQDIVQYAKEGYSGKQLMELTRGLAAGIDLSSFLQKGFNAEQLEEINNAFEARVNILPYVSEEFHGVQLQEIVKGLKQNIDVSRYAKPCYNWLQMRQLRFGLEDHLDISFYEDEKFTPEQMAEIRKGLLAGDNVEGYAKFYLEPQEMAEKRGELEESSVAVTKYVEDAIKQKGDFEEQILPQELEEEMEDTQSDEFLLDSCVKVSTDYMEASLCLEPVEGMYEDLKVPDIMRVLNHHDIKQGIMRDAIHDLLERKDFHDTVIVAKGREPVDGDDGHFVFYFRKELKRKPKVLENGTVDYKSMELFESVKNGQLVAEYVPATNGVFGYDITGKLLPPKRGKELPPLRGKGFMLTEDKKQYYSLLDGIIEMENDKRLDIRNIYTVPGNVDASTGNVNFNGDVNVMGSIEPGYSVIATGNVVVDGGCEGGSIFAGKDIVLYKGCQGQRTSVLHADGNIVGQFFESVKVEAGGDVMASYLLNSVVEANGTLTVEGKKGVIIGGHIIAKEGIKCFAIGNVAEVPTKVEVGINKDDLGKYQQKIKDLEKIQQELTTYQQALDKLMMQPDPTEKITHMCERLSKGIYIEKKRQKELLEERDEMIRIMNRQKLARIVIRGSVYPGTKIIMNSELFLVQENYSNVQFVKKENTIDIVNS